MPVEATHVYIIMRRDYRVSRNRRAAWYLSHLNQILKFSPKRHWKDCDETAELEVLSVLPPPSLSAQNLNRSTSNEDSVNSELSTAIKEINEIGAQNVVEYYLTNKTRVIFLARQYRLVVALDLSPSSAFVDIHTGCVISDAQIAALKKVLFGVTRPFYVPGTRLLFTPLFHLCILANSPFMSCSTPQVLLQGVTVDDQNVSIYLELIQTKLKQFETSVANCTKSLMGWSDEEEIQRSVLISDDGEDPNSARLLDDIYPKQKILSSPDVGLVTLLRYSLLSLELLPEKASRLAIVITDGMTGTPDPLYLDALLSQLRDATVACSFLQVATPFHPQNGFGYIPNTDVLQFLATATFGAYLETCPDIPNNIQVEMNIYHQALLCWDFQKGLDGFRLSFSLPPQPKCKGAVAAGIFLQEDPSISSEAHNMIQLLLRKRQLAYDVHASLAAILALRLREGYTIKSVQFSQSDTKIEVYLALPWRHNVRIEYLAVCSWPLSLNTSSITHVEITLEANYYFLHDLSQPQELRKKNPQRDMTVKKFRQVLHSLSQTDQFLVHMQSFSFNPAYYTLPDSVKNRVPLYYLPVDAIHSMQHQQFELSVQNVSKDYNFTQFTSFWKPILMLDINIWQKWLHTHRIGLILRHDNGPLPRHLHTQNSNGRYSVITCRQAATQLASFLSNWSSFVLMENHSYIQLLPQHDGDTSTPASFYLLRVVMKPPCVVLWLAFQGGTSGSTRHEIEWNLIQAVRNLKFPPRPLPRGDSPTRKMSGRSKHPSSVTLTPVFEKKEGLAVTKDLDVCCIMLHHPVERILIRYEKVPENFLIFSYADSSFYATTPTSNLYTALSKYLFHQRWIWTISPICDSITISNFALGRVLSTLTKIRLKEGFHFAYASQGIVNLVLEVAMNSGSLPLQNQKNLYTSVIQYIIFPPNLMVAHEDSFSDIDTDDGLTSHTDDLSNHESNQNLPNVQIALECWVTPQDGHAFAALGGNDALPLPTYLHGCNYENLAQSFLPIDMKTLSVMLTFETLVLICDVPITKDQFGSLEQDKAIELVHEFRSKHQSGFTTDMINGILPDSIGVDGGGTCSSHIHMFNHKFNLLNLLDLGQQVHVLLPILRPPLKNVPYGYLVDDSGQDERLNAVNINLQNRNSTIETVQSPLSVIARQTTPMNQMLFANFLEGLIRLNDSEINLNSEESFDFVLKCVKRQETDPTRGLIWPNEWQSVGKSYDDKLNGHCSNNCMQCLFHSDSSKTKNVCNICYIVPRWRCFIKCVSSTECFITLVPATFTDLINLLCPKQSNATKSSARGSTGGRSTFLDDHDNQSTPESENIIGRSRSSTLSVGTNQRNSNVSKLKTKSSVVNSPLSVSVTQLPTENFQDNFPSVSPEKSIPCFDNEDVKSPACKEEIENCVFSSKNNSGQADESLYLPVFIFRCSMQVIVKDLISGVWNEKKYYDDIFIDKTLRTEHQEININENSTDEGLTEDIQTRHREESDDYSQSAVFDAVFGSALGLKDHYGQVFETFNRGYIKALYRCLQTGLLVDPLDVQRAIDEFCEESLLEIDITSFLEMVCGHVSPVFAKKKLLGQISDETEDCMLFLNELNESNLWETTLGLHQVIKSKFNEMISSSFKPIPSSRGGNMYFFSCSLKKTESFISLEGTMEDGINFSGIGNQEALSVEPSEVPATDFSRFFSSDDDVSSSKNIEEEIFIDDVDDEKSVPLFLYLTCSIRNKENGKFVSIPVSGLPTCLRDLHENLILVKDKDEVVDLTKLIISLDFNFLTLPEDSDLPSAFVGGEPQGFIQKMERNSDDGQETNTDSIMEPSLLGKLEKLPHFQYTAVKRCIDEINWMLKDEIVGALHRTGDVSGDVLNYVVKHIRGAATLTNCIHHDVKLQFVFGPDISLGRFIDEFENSYVCGYEVKKEAEKYYYYILSNKDLNADKLSASEIEVSTPKVKKRKTERKVRQKMLSIESNDIGSESDSSSSFLRVKEKASEDVEYSSYLDRTCILNAEIESGLKQEKSLLSDNENDDHDFQPFQCNLKRSNSSVSFPLDCKKYPVENSLLNDCKIRHGSGGYFSYPSKKNASDKLKLTKDGIGRFEGTSRFSSFQNSSVSSFTEAGYDGGSSMESESDSDTDECNTKRINNCDLSEEISIEKKIPNILSDTIEKRFLDLWLIVQILPPSSKGGDYVVTVNWHTRDLGNGLISITHDPDDGDSKRTVYTQVINKIKQISRNVNQHLLLEDLYITRNCHRMLVPPSDEDAWRHRNPIKFQKKIQKGFNDLSEDDDDDDDSEEFGESGFLWCPDIAPGYFQCDCVWKRAFPLHPRLKTAAGKAAMLEKVKSILDKFSVKNRRDMYVYKETSTGNVFYLISTETTVQRSEILNPSIHGGNNHSQKTAKIEKGSLNKSKTQDCIELTVYGIKSVGQELKEQLVEVLQKRLDDATLDQIELLLLRNPQLKLQSEDVHFIQPPMTKPKHQIRFELNSFYHSRLAAIRFYLGQNLLQFLNNPKYMDANPLNHFVDYSQEPPTVFHEGEVFLFNSHKRSSVGNIGLCCIGLKALSSQLSNCERPCPDAWLEEFSIIDFQNELTELTSYSDIKPNRSRLQRSNSGSIIPGQSTSILFLIWSRGDDDMSFLTERLKASVQHSLLDFFMEYHFLTAPICLKPSHFYLRQQVTEILDSNTETSENSAETVLLKKDTLLDKLRYKLRNFSFSKQHCDREVKDVSNKTDIDSLLSQLIQEYEDGTLGRLNPLYVDSLPDWFEFCIRNSLPSVSKHVVGQIFKYPVESILNEFSSQIIQHTPDSPCRLFRFDDYSDKYFLVSHYKRNTKSEKPNQWIMISRNNNVWRKFLHEKQNEVKLTKDTNFFQKFQPLDTEIQLSQPLSSENFNLIVPRQKLIFIKACDKQLILYSYNLHPTIQASLSSTLQKLSQWFNARSHLMTSIVMQKMGLFHHYKFGDLSSEPFSNDTNPYITDEKNAEELIRLTKPKIYSLQSHRGRSSSLLKLNTQVSRVNEDVSMSSPSANESQIVNDVLRDAMPPKPLHVCSYDIAKDVIQKHGKQLLEVRHTEKIQRDKWQRLDELHYFWTESVGPTVNVPITSDLLRLLKKNSRLLHFVSSPLLFSPIWRESLLRGQNSLSSINVGKSSEPEWHQDIKNRFVQEYIQFLQSLGFVLVQTRSSSPKRQIQGRSLSSFSNYHPPLTQISSPTIRRESTESDPTQVLSKFLQKSFPAGIILLELAWTTGDTSQQRRLFSVKLYVLDCFHDLVENSKSSQIKIFLEEVDRLKDMTHLNSFSHDFHLRHIMDHISARSSILPRDYHLPSFAYDFSKFFTIAPRWARNKLLKGVISVNLASMSCSTVYEYLLCQDKQFNLKGKRIKPIESDFLEASGEMASTSAEYALTQHSIRKVTVPPEIPFASLPRRPAEEVDVGLIIYYNEKDTARMDLNNLSLKSKGVISSSNCHNLVLQFYLLGTSRRNLFPRITLDKLTVKNSTNNPPINVTQTLKDVDINSDTENGTNTVITTKRARSESFSLTKVTNNDNTVSWTSKTSMSSKDQIETAAGLVLESEMDSTRDRIVKLILEAKKHCRREDLWRRLVKGEDEAKARDSGNEHVAKLAFYEFEELMNSTSIFRRLIDADPQIHSFLNMNINWFQRLAKYLVNKFGESNCKIFESNDKVEHYYVILNPKNLKILVCLYLNTLTGTKDVICLCQDGPPQSLKHNRSSSFIVENESGTTVVDANVRLSNSMNNSRSLNELALQELVEDMINAMLFFMWMSLLA